MRSYNLLAARLGAFGDGGASAAGAGETAGTAPASAEAGSKAAEPVIKYGKQPTGESVQGAEAAQDALRAEYQELIQGKYRELYEADRQQLTSQQAQQMADADRRLTAQRPIIDLLADRYGVTDGDMAKLYNALLDSDPTLEQRAEDNGLTVEQQRHEDQMQREIARLRKIEEGVMTKMRAQDDANRWAAEGEAMRQKYPNFDLMAETKNPQFMRLLRARMPMEQAYFAVHGPEIMQATATQAAAGAEKRIVDNIRAQGLRPRENGTANSQGFVVKADPRTLTKQDRANIRERVKRGERIVF